MIDVYTMEGGQLTAEELEFLAREVFSDPIVEHYSIDAPLATPFDGAIIEVGFKPGVTDPVGITVLQAVFDALNKKIDGAYTLREYLLQGVFPDTAEIITRDLLANNLIERWQVQDGSTYAGFAAYIPKVVLQNDFTAEEIDINLSDNETFRPQS